MKQHAIVILYGGKELPEHTATEIVAAMCNDGVTTPELVTVKYYDGDSISDAVLKSEEWHEVNGSDNAIKNALKIIFREISVSKNIAFQIRIAAFLGRMRVYVGSGAEIEEKDRELLTAIRIVAMYNDDAIRLYPETYHAKIKEVKTCFESCW